MIPRTTNHLPVRPPEPPRLSSMCMGIADFTHDDCLGGPCGCDCGHPHLASSPGG